MKIKFLGSGSAFVLGKENYQSNILIESGNDSLLYDAGTSIADALDYNGYDPFDIKNIFISHNHADHSGGLEYLGFKTYYSHPIGRKDLNLYATANVIQKLWTHNLQAGMEICDSGEANLSTYFRARAIKDHFYIDDDNIECLIVRNDHCGWGYPVMPSYGLYICDTNNDFYVYISGDTRTVNIQNCISSDIIFHDCELNSYPNSVHTQYHELCNLDPQIKAKMWLYHYTTNNGNIELPDAVSDGFLGFVQRGQVFNFNE